MNLTERYALEQAREQFKERGMKFQDAVQILRRLGTKVDETGLYNLGHYIGYRSGFPNQITLDDEFGVEELEAIVVFMKTVMANPRAISQLLEDEAKS